jgi:hypothetical protein
MPKRQPSSSWLPILLVAVVAVSFSPAGAIGTQQSSATSTPQICPSLYSLLSDSGQIYVLDGIPSGNPLEQYPNMTYVTVTGWFASSSHAVTLVQTFTVEGSATTFTMVDTGVGGSNYAGTITAQTVQVGPITYTFGMTVQIVQSTGSAVISTGANPHVNWATPISISGRLFYGYVPCPQLLNPLGTPVVPGPLQEIVDALKKLWSWFRCLFGSC